MRILNLGILAHVDAGKTSLTERILFETGVIRSVGRVDRGTTQTDSMDLERQRGITIRSAVVSFQLGDLTVNLIDTPGHADFVAEVERSLLALDAVVLVISAVEGVQAQTRRLLRVVRELGLPVIVFINKIDRMGARVDEVLADIRTKLDLRVLPLNQRAADGRSVFARPLDDPASRDATIDLLAERDDALIAAYAEDRVTPALIERAFRTQIASGEIAPVWIGSALQGIGVTDLLDGLRTWLPTTAGDPDAPLAGVVFKIQRSPSGEKLVYVRLMSGRIALREHITLVRRTTGGESTHDARITAIDRFVAGETVIAASAEAGEIVCLHGLRDAQIGDWLGHEPASAHRIGFAPPALESVVRPTIPARLADLFVALTQLAEQDPLIAVRRDEHRHEISVRLYGEVQKEVIATLLATDYRLDVIFDESHVVCIERPIGTGFAIEEITDPANPFAGTVGLRVEPGVVGGGVTFTRPSGALPLAFYLAIEETVRETLAEGLHGWEVHDIAVTLTDTAYASPVTTAADFRKLTPLVLMAALREAGTVVCEPVAAIEIELPGDTLGAVLDALVASQAIPTATVPHSASILIAGTMPSALVHAFEQRLPGLTRGEGVMTNQFAAYEPIAGEPPERERTDHHPLDRKRYLAEISQQ